MITIKMSRQHFWTLSIYQGKTWIFSSASTRILNTVLAAIKFLYHAYRNRNIVRG